jgi:hypothetical protein
MQLHINMARCRCSKYPRSAGETVAEANFTANPQERVSLRGNYSGVVKRNYDVLPVKAKAKLKRGDFMLEDELNVPCRALMLARALVDPTQVTDACRLLNLQTMIKLRKDTPTSALVPLMPVTTSTDGPTLAIAFATNPADELAQSAELLSMDEKRQALELKGFSIEGNALRGRVLDQFIQLLHENMDMIATIVAELPAVDILTHRIEIGDSPPIRKRTYKQSHRIKQISGPTKMLERGIIAETDSPWASPINIVAKKMPPNDSVLTFALYIA